MDSLAIISIVGSMLTILVSVTVLITFFRTTRKDIKIAAKSDAKEATTYAVNQQYILNDLKEIKVQLAAINQKNESNLEMAVRLEERQIQTSNRLTDLEGRIGRAFSLINKIQGGGKH